MLVMTRERLKHFIAAHPLVPDRFRPRLLRTLGAEIPASAIVFCGLRLSGPGRFTVGERAFINQDCVIDASADVTIGARVALGNRVMILTSAHEYSDPSERAGGRTLRPVVIGDGAWLGAGAMVLPGVTVGAGAVVGAGSVVTKDCAPHGLYAGVPAVFVRALPTDES